MAAGGGYSLQVVIQGIYTDKVASDERRWLARGGGYDPGARYEQGVVHRERVCSRLSRWLGEHLGHHREEGGDVGQAVHLRCQAKLALRGVW